MVAIAKQKELFWIRQRVFRFFGKAWELGKAFDLTTFAG
jgi:hypothetical protein